MSSCAVHIGLEGGYTSFECGGTLRGKVAVRAVKSLRLRGISLVAH
jgi:hypothetical protein